MHSNFQQNRVSRSVKTVHTNLFANCINLHAIKILKITPFGHARPLTGIQADFEINLPVRYQISTDDRQTGGKTSH